MSTLLMLSHSHSMNEGDVGSGWREVGGEKHWVGQPEMGLPWQPIDSFDHAAVSI